MKKYILIGILISGFLAHGEVAFANGTGSFKSWNEPARKAVDAHISRKKPTTVAQHQRSRNYRRDHRPPPSRKIYRAQVFPPVVAAGVIFQTGAQIILPWHPPLSAHYPYRINGVVHQRWPSHCSYILGYSQQRTLPPEWTVESFNGEVIFCREAFFPTLTLSIEPPGPPPPANVPAPVPQRLSFSTDSHTCRHLAYEAANGDPVATTVKGGVVGGALGAAAGAAIGAATGDPGKGAAIGAAAGGIGGATINNIQSSREYQTAYANCMQRRGHEVLY